MKRLEVRQGKWMLFDRHEMQPAAARRIAAPRLPGGEEVQAQAEAGFEDDEALAARPARWKIVTREEHVARLGETARSAVINVVERFRVGNPVPECRAGGDQGRAHAPIV